MGELKKLKKLEKFFAKLILFSGAQGSKGKRQMFLVDHIVCKLRRLIEGELLEGD